MKELKAMFDLERHNTFKMKVKAQNGLFINTAEDLAKLDTDKYLILGSGSDVLFVDDYSGTVLINAIKSLEIKHEGNFYKVRAGGGILLDSLISELVAKGAYGLENLSAVPGTVGAAPVQNVGAYGAEIGDYIESVEFFDLSTKKAGKLLKKDCLFAYRHSIFKEDFAKSWFITYVNFSLPDTFTPNFTYKGIAEEGLLSAKAVRDKIIALRSAKLPDPKLVGNAGSFFKNPIVDKDTVEVIKSQYQDVPVYPFADGLYKLAAGWLIDRAGCRGITQGNAGTWEHQALVLVNRGGARPCEIISLGKYICAKVKEKFAVDLYPEVRFIGKDGEVFWQDL